MEALPSRVVGIDLAKRSYVAHIIDPNSEKAQIWEGKTDTGGIDRLCAKLQPHDRLGMECCAFAFRLAKILQERVHCKVLVLNPGELAIIYKSVKKTDLADAGKIAWLLNRHPDEELPTVTLPTEQEEHRRALVSELRSKKKARTALINRLHSLFVRQGLVVLTKEDLRTARNRDENIRALSDFTLGEAKRIQEELSMMESHIETIEQEIKDDLKAEPVVAQLLSIPGVGPATAMAYLAHVGDGSRFSRARQVSHFVGMTPRVDSSGETTRLGSITKRGCTAIRSLIVQSAWAAVHTHRNHKLKEKYQELVHRIGKGRAIVAVARRLLELMWIISRRKEFYHQTSMDELRFKMARSGLKMHFVGSGT